MSAKPLSHCIVLAHGPAIRPYYFPNFDGVPIPNQVPKGGNVTGEEVERDLGKWLFLKCRHRPSALATRDMYVMLTLSRDAATTRGPCAPLLVSADEWRGSV